jgi:hypothetical protein
VVGVGGLGCFFGLVVGVVGFDFFWVVGGAGTVVGGFVGGGCVARPVRLI